MRGTRAGRTVQQGLAVMVALSLTALAAVGADATVDRAPRPQAGDTLVGAARGRLVAALGAAAWHRDGSRGQGVKVAVLDSGFRGYRSHLGHGLPARVTARSFRGDGNLEARDSQHGILCGEVIHALAPDAQLLFANWEPDRPEQFLAAVRWAREQGARVISCSVIMPSWSDGEGNGPVHEGMRKVLGPGGEPRDLLCFASAGNTAQRHWAGAAHADGSGWHEWAQGVVDNPVVPWDGDTVSVELCWPRGGEFELQVHDVAKGAAVGKAGRNPSGPRTCTVVRFDPEPGHLYAARVRATGGPAPFHLVALGADLGHAVKRGSIPFPGDGPEVLAVGAVNEQGRRAEYSSCGPNSARPKPDLVATVPFPCQGRSKPFGGTSAAAPQAAALAALVWSRHPEWTANQVREALVKSARDLAVPGHDIETGYGQIALPAAK